MFSKLRISEWLVGLGVVLLFGATFKPWFTVPGAEKLEDLATDALLEGSTSLGTGLNVWDLGFTRWFVYLALICAALMLVAAVFGETVHFAIVMATPTVLFSFICSIGMIVRLIWPPAGASETETAFYVAVAGSLLIFLAGCWSIRDEYVPPGYEPAPDPERISLESTPSSAPGGPPQTTT